MDLNKVQSILDGFMLDCTVVTAAITGSKGSGLVGKYSDTDITAIVLSNRKEAYTVESDHIATHQKLIDQDIDLTVWDLRKFYSLLQKANCNAYEVIAAEVTYDNPRFKRELYRLASTAETFPVEPMCLHSYHQAHSIFVKAIACYEADSSAVDKILKHLVQASLTMERCLYMIEDKRPYRVLHHNSYSLSHHINLARSKDPSQVDMGSLFSSVQSLLDTKGTLTKIDEMAHIKYFVPDIKQPVMDIMQKHLNKLFSTKEAAWQQLT